MEAEGLEAAKQRELQRIVGDQQRVTSKGATLRASAEDIAERKMDPVSSVSNELL